MYAGLKIPAIENLGATKVSGGFVVYGHFVQAH